MLELNVPIAPTVVKTQSFQWPVTFRLGLSTGTVVFTTRMQEMMGFPDTEEFIESIITTCCGAYHKGEYLINITLPDWLELMNEPFTWIAPSGEVHVRQGGGNC